MTDNLSLWEQFRNCPKTAQKPITGGRLRGKTDISPIWRMKTLTEAFGPCGFGWKYEVTDRRQEEGGGGEIAVFVDINLYVNKDGKWSSPIPGTGGSMFVSAEEKGLYVNDECYKMALTDAISVSCKALGVAADIYWDGDSTKYSPPGKPEKREPVTPKREPAEKPEAGKPAKSDKVLTYMIGRKDFIFHEQGLYIRTVAPVENGAPDTSDIKYIGSENRELIEDLPAGTIVTVTVESPVTVTNKGTDYRVLVIKSMEPFDTAERSN